MPELRKSSILTLPMVKSQNQYYGIIFDLWFLLLTLETYLYEPQKGY
jgi:hypothetical protein